MNIGQVVLVGQTIDPVDEVVASILPLEGTEPVIPMPTSLLRTKLLYCCNSGCWLRQGARARAPRVSRIARVTCASTRPRARAGVARARSRSRIRVFRFKVTQILPYAVRLLLRALPVLDGKKAARRATSGDRSQARRGGGGSRRYGQDGREKHPQSQGGARHRVWLSLCPARWRH